MKYLVFTQFLDDAGDLISATQEVKSYYAAEAYCRDHLLGENVLSIAFRRADSDRLTIRLPRCPIE